MLQIITILTLFPHPSTTIACNNVYELAFYFRDKTSTRCGCKRSNVYGAQGCTRTEQLSQSNAINNITNGSTSNSTHAIIIIAPPGPYSLNDSFVQSRTNICPGACVMATGNFACIKAACGVTPHAQKTGTSPSRIVTGSP